MVVIDFETRSIINLKARGAYVYSSHPTTRVLCMAVSDGHVYTDVEKITDFLRGLVGTEVHAWNANFERLIAENVLGVKGIRWRCLAARARAQALPGRLEDCARALALPIRKDMDGHKLMLKLCNAANPEPTDGELERLARYCVIDVDVSVAIAAHLRHDPEDDRDYWINEQINDRGALIDVPFCRNAARYIGAERAELDTEIAHVTRGAVAKCTQVKRIITWLAAHEIETTTIDREWLTATLERDDLAADVRDVLELREAASNTAGSKFAAMAARADADRRVRGALLFAGAGQTGRYSSTGIQLHNLKRSIPRYYGQYIRDVNAAAPPAVLRLKYGPLIRNFASLVRPAIIAPPNKWLIIGDYSQVEARMLPWLAGADLEVAEYAIGVDKYLDDAARIFHVAREDVTDMQRQVGKVARLSLGFGGGHNAFRAMGKNYDVQMNEGEARQIVNTWRATNDWAPRFWRQVNTALTAAMRSPGTVQLAGRHLAYQFDGLHLWLRLPSERLLCYPFATLKREEGPYGERDVVTSLKATRKPPAKPATSPWPRVTLWHGLAVENACQAACADLLRHALSQCEISGYRVVLHTHDEIVAESTSSGTEGLKHTMEIKPRWADTFPLDAKVRASRRYAK